MFLPEEGNFMLASRRSFFRTAMSLGVAGSAFPLLSSCSRSQGAPLSETGLIADPEGLLDLPPGFTYTVHSPAGERMSDGHITPGSHDGMACFPVDGDADRCLLVRNHELDPDEGSAGAFINGSVTSEVAAKSYDRLRSGEPMPGGTTTLLFNLRTRRVERSHLSLAGTVGNCSGGLTPWGSWLSCEESRDKAGDICGKDHGYVFEVPATLRGLADPVPLTAMGRFNHEATATDPRTGIIYQTEDEGDSLFYRFLPDAPGELAKGGRLQILSLKGLPGADTSNWNGVQLHVGGSWPVEWLDIDHVTSPDGDLRLRGHAKGAAMFARGEGMAFAVEPAGNAIYFACTSGGPARKGQIWKYVPGAFEGTSDEASAPGMLTLHYESPGVGEMDMCDNIVASPWGDLTVCEDGDDDSFVRGVTPEGRVYSICRAGNGNDSEFAGACWAPDGETLFVNLQGPHMTFSIRGPWATIARV